MIPQFLYLNLERFILYICALGIIFAAPACQSLGSHVTQLDISMRVEMAESLLEKAEISHVPSPPLWPFDLPHFENEISTWTFQVHVDGFSADIKNTSQQTLDILWSDSRWRSSFQESWTDFLVYEQYVGRQISRKVATANDKNRPFVPERWLLQPGEEEYFAFRATVGKTRGNPDGLLFGISNADVISGSYVKAIDNWIEIELPVAASNNRKTYLFRFVFDEAASWVSYY